MGVAHLVAMLISGRLLSVVLDLWIHQLRGQYLENDDNDSLYALILTDSVAFQHVLCDPCQMRLPFQLSVYSVSGTSDSYLGLLLSSFAHDGTLPYRTFIPFHVASSSLSIATRFGRSCSQFMMSTLTAHLQHKVKKSSKKPLRWLRKATFAERSTWHGPFGEREVLPCDFLASGGTLKIIEKFIDQTIEPHLARERDGSILPKKRLIDTREEARGLIQRATNCSEHHVVLFTESSFDDVFLSYIQALDVPKLCAESFRPPVILLGQDLGGSLHIEVRKIGAEVSSIPLDADGRYDLRKLEALLKFYRKQGRTMVGAFSVGDEMTGVLNDTQQMTALLHTNGALSVWDYSSAGAFTKIDICPIVSYGGLTYKDAAFIRTDRFLGGEGSSNVFITKGTALVNPMFETVLEGILAYSCVEGEIDKSLSAHSTRDPALSRDRQRRIVAGPVRARSAFELKGYFGDCYLQKRTLEISERLSRGLLHQETVHVAGGRPDAIALPYLSLLFFHPHTEWAMHHGFIVALLQDLFGISAAVRPATVHHLPETPQLECQRAMHSILSQDSATEFVDEKIMHVGCVHFSLMYFMRDIDLDYLSSAILLVAQQGWRLLPFYRFNVTTGKWIMPHNFTSKAERLGNTMAKLRAIQSSTQSVRFRHVSYLERARKLLQSISDKTVRKTLKEGHSPQGDEGLSPGALKLRWFMTPADALELLDDASPVRLSKNTAAEHGVEKRRTWPGTSPTVASPTSFRSRPYRRRFGQS